MKLYHYTCFHGAEGIARDGVIKPWGHPYGPIPPLVWMTTMNRPHRHNLGLTTYTIACDRTAYRVGVDVADARKWTDWADAYATTAEFRRWRALLEYDREVASWYIWPGPVEAGAIVARGQYLRRSKR